MKEKEDVKEILGNQEDPGTMVTMGAKALVQEESMTPMEIPDRFVSPTTFPMSTKNHPSQVKRMIKMQEKGHMKKLIGLLLTKTSCATCLRRITKQPLLLWWAAISIPR